MLGQKVKSIDRGGVYIINGKKVVVTKKNENDYSYGAIFIGMPDMEVSRIEVYQTVNKNVND